MLTIAVVYHGMTFEIFLDIFTVVLISINRPLRAKLNQSINLEIFTDHDP